MLGFLPTVIAITVFARLIKLCVPDIGEYKKYISLFSGLCVTAVMLSPISEIVSLLSSGVRPEIDLPVPSESYEEIFESEIAEGLLPSVEAYVSRVLEETFSILSEEREIHVEFKTTGDVIAIETVSIHLTGSARFKDTAAISDYFEEKLECIVRVSVDLD